MSNKDCFSTNYKYSINFRISSPPPLTPPTRGGGKTFPPPRWGRPGGGAELLHIIYHVDRLLIKNVILHTLVLLFHFFPMNQRHVYTCRQKSFCLIHLLWRFGYPSSHSVLHR